MQVLLTGTKSEQVKVTVSHKELINNVKLLVSSRYKFSSDYWIEDGKVMDTVDYHHGSLGQREIRDASAEDIRAYNLLKELNYLEKNLDERT